MDLPGDLRYCGLILTERCNLSCRYCYQNAPTSRRMSWETARAAIDRFLASRSDELEFLFTGGEPMLEFPLMRRAVAYIEECNSRDRKITFRISTNGTLLGPDEMEFLAQHRFETQISFDGLAEAQDVRGKDTFPIIESTLAEFRKRFPVYFRKHLRVTITIVPDTVRHLADSVDYLVGSGIPQVMMNPAMTFDPLWRPERIEEIEVQYRRIFDMSVEHYRRTKKVPVSSFRGRRADEECGGGGGAMCGVVCGRTIAVDAGGEAFGCGSFVPSYQSLGEGLLARSLEPLRMGRIDAPGFEERRRAYVDRIDRTRMFQVKEEKYSSYGKCGECQYLERCLVCPVSIGHVPENADPDRVPDFVCAFRRTALKYRKEFPAQPSLKEIFTPPPELLSEMDRWKGMADRLRARRGIPAQDQEDHGDEQPEQY